MNREAALHFRDQLRASRAAALRDAERYQEIVLTLERLGAYLVGTMTNLGKYKDSIEKVAQRLPMATDVPRVHSDLRTDFSKKYEMCGEVGTQRFTKPHSHAILRSAPLSCHSS